MPYDIHVRGGKHCVMKRGTKSPRPGRCHDTRAEAIKQQRALYAAEADQQSQSAQEVTGMSTDMTVTFTDGSGQVIKFAPVADAEDSQDGTTSWEGVLAIIGFATSDKRILIPGEIGNRDLPLPLMVQTATSDGHGGAEVAGRIETIDYIPMSEFDKEGFSLDGVPDTATVVFGTGVFDGSDAAREAERMIENGADVSIDIPTDRLALIDPETLQEVPEDQVDLGDVLSGKYLTGLAGKIAGATVVTIGAFEDARITITEDTALVASSYGLRIKPTLPQVIQVSNGDLDAITFVAAASGGGNAVPGAFIEDLVQHALVSRPVRDALTAAAAPLKPPADWFQNPNLMKLSPLTITKEGRIFGHLADWDGCHTGFTSVCVPPFRSSSNYAYFNVGEIETADGSMVPIGKLMFSREEGVGHAPLSLSAEDASKWYDDSTKIAGFVQAGGDRFGTWLAGVLAPGLSDEDLLYLRANPPSGDWRPSVRWAGSELLAAFSVPIPGFPIPRMMVASGANGELTIITAPLNMEMGPRAKTRQIAMLKARLHSLVAKSETTPDDMIWMTADALEGEFAPTAEQRRAWAKSGVALDDGSFPITKCTGDGTSAINARRAIGRAPESKRESVRRHIAKRERALGCSNE